MSCPPLVLVSSHPACSSSRMNSLRFKIGLDQAGREMGMEKDGE